MTYFRRKQIIELLDIHPSTWKEWSKRYFNPILGRGKRTDYDGADVIIFSIIKILSQAGYSYQGIERIVSFLKKTKYAFNPARYHEIRQQFENLSLEIEGNCHKVELWVKPVGSRFYETEGILPLPEHLDEIPFPWSSVNMSIDLCILMDGVLASR